MDEQKKSDMKKVWLLVFIAIALIVFVVVYSIIGNAKKVKRYPDALLMKEAGKPAYELDEKLLPFVYSFNDMDYAIGVPSKGLIYVEGGYAYSQPDFGLVISEVSKPRSMEAFSADIYPSLYAIQNPPEVKQLKGDEGYINQYPAKYGVFSVYMKDIDLLVYEVCYLIECDRENVILLANVEGYDLEKLNKARDMLMAVAKSLTPYRASSSSETVVEEQSKAEVKTDPGAVTREAIIPSERDYENLRLSFVYMDVSSSPEECYVIDPNGDRVNPIQKDPGEIVFLLGKVAAGDEINVIVTSRDLKGTSVEQMEQTDYLNEKTQMTEGVLHVEEEYTEELITE